MTDAQEGSTRGRAGAREFSSWIRNAVGSAQEFLARRRTVYLQTFLCPPGEEVLRDLARFCRAHDTTFAVDARAHAVAEGRREVWLRIQRHLRLSEDELWQLYGQTNQPLRKPDNE